MDWLLTYADPTIDWEYAMVTLVVRFIGVFVVMALVQVGMQTASRVIMTMEARAARPKKADVRSTTPAMSSLDVSAMADAESGLDGHAVAAIGLALALEAERRAGASPMVVAVRGAGAPSAWAMSGRMRGMR